MEAKIISLLQCHIREYAGKHWQSVIVDTSKSSSRIHSQTENLQKERQKKRVQTTKTYQLDILFSTAKITSNNEN